MVNGGYTNAQGGDDGLVTQAVDVVEWGDACVGGSSGLRFIAWFWRRADFGVHARRDVAWLVIVIAVTFGAFDVV